MTHPQFLKSKKARESTYTSLRRLLCNIRRQKAFQTLTLTYRNSLLRISKCITWTCPKAHHRPPCLQLGPKSTNTISTLAQSIYNNLRQATWTTQSFKTTVRVWQAPTHPSPLSNTRRLSTEQTQTTPRPGVLTNCYTISNSNSNLRSTCSQQPLSQMLYPVVVTMASHLFWSSSPQLIIHSNNSNSKQVLDSQPTWCSNIIKLLRR